MANSYISNFIDSLSLIGDNKALAEVLFKSEQDCNDFYIGFLGRNRYVIDDLLDYREERLTTSDIPLDKFLNMCDNMTMKEIVEKTFLQPVTIDEVELIINAINDGKTSLIRIHQLFQFNTNENILKHVL